MLPIDVLSDPRYQVPTVPPAADGVAWLRSQVVRFSEGTDHGRRRALVERLVAEVSPDRLRRSGDHVATLAEALGVPRSVAADVRAVAACYQPHAGSTPAADAAVDRLVAACGGTWDERTAARICVLVQACDATSHLIDGDDPPVPETRRLDPEGDEVLVDLAGTPFGSGRHACPGEELARALADGVTRFRRLHDGPEVLVLPNAWDVGSAAVFAAAGVPAIGTTSMGVAAASGLADGRGLTADSTLTLAERLVGLDVPITVDVEDGWGRDPADLAAQLWEMGVAGLNVEDSCDGRLVDPDAHRAVVAAMKAAAPRLFVNARVDTWWLSDDRSSTLARARRYADAGADGVFVPAADEATVEEVVAVVGVPVNVLADRPVARWLELGVRRVSTGSLPYRAALRAAADVAAAVAAGARPPQALALDEVNGLFA